MQFIKFRRFLQYRSWSFDSLDKMFRSKQYRGPLCSWAFPKIIRQVCQSFSSSMTMNTQHQNNAVLSNHWHVYNNLLSLLQNFCQKPGLKPGQARAKPWVAALAWPSSWESRSRLGQSQSRGFQAKPGRNITSCVDNFTIETASKCSTCNSCLLRVTTFIQMPPLLAFDLGNNAPLLDPVLWISCQCHDTHTRYSLRGIIYFENSHFTEHVITSTGMVWFHDGMFTGRSLLYETNNLTSISRDHAVMAFYSRDQNSLPERKKTELSVR